MSARRRHLAPTRRVSDAGRNTVDATLTYTRTDGSTTTEQHQLPLVRSGGGYLIDGDN